MKMVNQAGVGSSLVGRVDFDEFTAARRCSGLCPSANRASDSKRTGALLSRSRVKPAGEEIGGIITPVRFRLIQWGAISAISRIWAARSQKLSQNEIARAERTTWPRTCPGCGALPLSSR